jgi:hypothetical protein
MRMTPMVKPSLDDLQQYCLSRRNGIDPVAFLDYYDSVGWMVGKKPMKDWQAAVRTWERNRRQAVPRNSIIENLNDRSCA